MSLVTCDCKHRPPQANAKSKYRIILQSTKNSVVVLHALLLLTLKMILSDMIHCLELPLLPRLRVPTIIQEFQEFWFDHRAPHAFYPPGTCDKTLGKGSFIRHAADPGFVVCSSRYKGLGISTEKKPRFCLRIPAHADVSRTCLS